MSVEGLSNRVQSRTDEMPSLDESSESSVREGSANAPGTKKLQPGTSSATGKARPDRRRWTYEEEQKLLDGHQRGLTVKDTVASLGLRRDVLPSARHLRYLLQRDSGSSTQSAKTPAKRHRSSRSDDDDDDDARITPHFSCKRWNEREERAMSRLLADGYDCAEIQLMPVGRHRTGEAVRKRAKKLEAAVITTEKRDLSFPRDNIAAPGWTDMHSLRLRRALRQRMAAEDAWQAWFLTFEVGIVEKKLSAYEAQMGGKPPPRASMIADTRTLDDESDEAETTDTPDALSEPEEDDTDRTPPSSKPPQKAGNGSQRTLVLKSVAPKPNGAMTIDHGQHSSTMPIATERTPDGPAQHTNHTKSGLAVRPKGTAVKGKRRQHLPSEDSLADKQLTQEWQSSLQTDRVDKKRSPQTATGNGLASSPSTGESEIIKQAEENAVATAPLQPSPEILTSPKPDTTFVRPSRGRPSGLFSQVDSPRKNPQTTAPLDNAAEPPRYRSILKPTVHSHEAARPTAPDTPGKLPQRMSRAADLIGTQNSARFSPHRLNGESFSMDSSPRASDRSTGSPIQLVSPPPAASRRLWLSPQRGGGVSSESPLQVRQTPLFGSQTTRRNRFNLPEGHPWNKTDDETYQEAMELARGPEYVSDCYDILMLNKFRQFAMLENDRDELIRLKAKERQQRRERREKYGKPNPVGMLSSNPIDDDDTTSVEGEIYRTDVDLDAIDRDSESDVEEIWAAYDDKGLYGDSDSSVDTDNSELTDVWAPTAFERLKARPDKQAVVPTGRKATATPVAEIPQPKQQPAVRQAAARAHDSIAQSQPPANITFTASPAKRFVPWYESMMADTLEMHIPPAPKVREPPNLAPPKLPYSSDDDDEDDDSSDSDDA